MSEEMTLGEVFHAAFGNCAAEEFGADSGWTAWAETSLWQRRAIEAGAQAVAKHLGAMECEPAAATADAGGSAAVHRYALVEQMGHRATTGTIREVTFLGKQMLEVTDLRNGSVHLAAPESLYEVTWLTEDEARTRVRPWTAAAIGPVRPPGWPVDDVEDAAARDEDEAEGEFMRDAASLDSDFTRGDQ